MVNKGGIMETSTWITLGVIVLAIVWAIAIYNQLVQLKNRFQNGFAQIEVQLKRRYDLIPNLVEVVKGYAKHEADTLQAVTEARAKVGSMQVNKDVLNNPESLNKFQQAQSEFFPLSVFCVAFQYQAF